MTGQAPEREPWWLEADLDNAPRRPRREPERWDQPPRDPWESSPRIVWLEWHKRAKQATWELYRRHGWDPLVVGPLPDHSMSGVEQTELLALLLSKRHPAAVDGACAGITEALLEIMGELATQLRQAPVPRPAGAPDISGGLAFPET